MKLVAEVAGSQGELPPVAQGSKAMLEDIKGVSCNRRANVPARRKIGLWLRGQSTGAILAAGVGVEALPVGRSDEKRRTDAHLRRERIHWQNISVGKGCSQ